MTQKLTFKGLAALSMINVEVKDEPKVESKPIKVETYQQVEMSVPAPKVQGQNDSKKLKMKPRFQQKQSMTPIQMAIHKYEQKELAEKMSDRAYKAWVEAVARRHYKDVHITATAEELVETRTVRDSSLTAKRS